MSYCNVPQSKLVEEYLSYTYLHETSLAKPKLGTQIYNKMPHIHQRKVLPTIYIFFDNVMLLTAYTLIANYN